jgi:catechol 2,3-dioxygenase-like lactoylglutathione lyase family enzyme
MFELDHIVVSCTDLDAGREWVSSTLGVPLQPGGQHPRYGTHNALMRLEDGLYLEVIAKDPSVQRRDHPTWFGLDTFAGSPRLTNWVCRAPDLAAAVAQTPALGVPVAMVRNDLRWDITVPTDGGLPLDGGFPTLITWAKDSPHPARRLIPVGCRLTRWEVHHPQASDLRAQVALDDPRVVFVTAPHVAFRAHIETPSGNLVLT